MEEKRKSKRFSAELNLEVSSLFKQDNIEVKDLHAPIQVVDVSRTGIGFHSSACLPIGYYFNACLCLGAEDARLFCVVRIVRSSDLGQGKYGYGCEFVGLAPVFSYIFDEFEKNAVEK